MCYEAFPEIRLWAKGFDHDRKKIIDLSLTLKGKFLDHIYESVTVKKKKRGEHLCEGCKSHFVFERKWIKGKHLCSICEEKKRVKDYWAARPKCITPGCRTYLAIQNGKIKSGYKRCSECRRQTKKNNPLRIAG